MSKYSYPLPIPYFKSFEQDILPGQCIQIKGWAFGPDRFDINLVESKDTKDTEIAFHMSFRFDEKEIVLNSKINDEWGDEQRHKLRFKADEDNFTVRIRAHEDNFELYVNNDHIGNYEFRKPLQKIHGIFIDGELELFKLSWEGKYYSIPYSYMVSEFGPAHRVYVSGNVEEKAERFNVNFMVGEDVGFHYNPRFDDKVVVRNTKQGNQWEDEEREDAAKFPFKKDDAFDLVFEVQKDGFYVAVNDLPHCDYKHRIDPTLVTEIIIEGDVDLHGFHVVPVS